MQIQTKLASDQFATAILFSLDNGYTQSEHLYDSYNQVRIGVGNQKSEQYRVFRIEYTLEF